jgi:excisionase family DNA binding protein
MLKTTTGLVAHRLDFCEDLRPEHEETMASDRLRIDLQASAHRDDLKAPRARSMASLSTREAADTLGISEQAVRRAIARGVLAAVKKGRGYRIRRDELDRYAQRRGGTRQAQPRDKIVALPNPVPGPTLPMPATRFVGRVVEMATLMALLRDPAERVVTVTGPGGIGKTRLALAVAAMVRDSFPDGVHFVDLTSVNRPQMVVSVVAQSLGLREQPDRDQRTQLVAFLQGKSVLVVLDNFEQVLDAAPEVARIVAHAPELSVLVTSRAPLRIGGERVLLAPPLSLPGDRVDVAALLASDAGQLFVERAREQDATYAVDDASAPMIVDICARLDGLPLAIELAAARSKVLPPRMLRDRLKSRLPVLTSGLRDAPSRHSTMRDAIAWSYNLLSPGEQRCFRQLAVFSGGWTMEAADAVLGNHDADGGTTVDAIEQLLDQSLLTTVQGPEGEPRFRMLETIREFGLERLQPEEEREARASHARFFLRLAQTLRPLTNTQALSALFAQLMDDEANLRAALDWLAEHGPAVDFAAIVAASYRYWYIVGRLRDSAAWVEQALAQRDDVADIDWARLLIGRAELLMAQGEGAQARAVLAEALSLLRAAGDPYDLAAGLIAQGGSLNLDAEYREGEAYLVEALSVAETIGDLRQRAAMTGRVLGNLGVSARGRGDLALAAARVEAALRGFSDQMLDWAAAHALVDLGDIAKDRGLYGVAFEHYLAGLELVGARGEPRMIADALAGIACAATAWGHHRSALLLVGAASALHERGGAALIDPINVAATERSLDILREALPDEVFAATRDEGRALPVAEAIALAAAISPPGGEQSFTRAEPEQRLTRRERDILNLLSQSLTDREIGEALFLSPRTVNWHMRSILAKLGASTRRDAVERARTSELL